MKKETTQNVFMENQHGMSVCVLDKIKTTKSNPSEARGINTN